MPIWIALIRGINVGGNNLLPMKELVRDLESLGLDNVRTYIQSGNAIFSTNVKSDAALAKKISDQIENRHSFRPHVFLILLKDLEQAIRANPFPEAVGEPKSLHFFFLDQRPAEPDLKALDAAQSPRERYRLTGNIFYLYAPDGVGRSKLAANVERYLGVAATARNYRTVEKLAALAAAGE